MSHTFHMGKFVSYYIRIQVSYNNQPIDVLMEVTANCIKAREPVWFGCEVDEVIIEVPAGSLWRISSGSGSTLDIEILLGRLTFGVDFLEEDF